MNMVIAMIVVKAVVVHSNVCITGIPTPVNVWTGHVRLMNMHLAMAAIAIVVHTILVCVVL